MKTVLLILFWLVMLAGSLWAVLHFWLKYNDVTLSGHGMTALVLGVVVSLAVGIGLMRLVYWSSKNGYD